MLSAIRSITRVAMPRVRIRISTCFITLLSPFFPTLYLTGKSPYLNSPKPSIYTQNYRLYQSLTWPLHLQDRWALPDVDCRLEDRLCTRKVCRTLAFRFDGPGRSIRRTSPRSA